MKFAVTRLFVALSCLCLLLVLLLIALPAAAAAAAATSIDVAATKRLVCRQAGFRFGVPGYLTCILDAVAFGDVFCLPVIINVQL
jgi:hypothetical protein